MSHIAAPAPADRFALIIGGLCQALGRRAGRGGLAGPFLLLIWTRLRRYAARFTRHAMTPLPSCPVVKRRTPSPRRSQPPPLPRRNAWLLRMVPETAAYTSQLRHFLADPEVAILLAEAPQLRRILRPLCQMLGIRPPQALPPPAPPGAAASAPFIPSQAPPQAAAALPVASPHRATPPPQPSCDAPFAVG